MLRRLIGSILLAQAPFALAQTAAGDFVVGDIRVEGLQRISEGTVYNYLPVNIGDRLDARRTQEAIRALFATGFFRDIELRRDGGTLVVACWAAVDRASRSMATRTSHRTCRSLRNVGLATGKTDRSVLGGARLPDRPGTAAASTRSASIRRSRRAGNKVRIKIGSSRAKSSGSGRSRSSAICSTRMRICSGTQAAAGLVVRYKQDDRYRVSRCRAISRRCAPVPDRGYADFDIESTVSRSRPARTTCSSRSTWASYTVGECASPAR